MFWKIIKLVILVTGLILALLAFGFIYQNIPSDPESLVREENSNENIQEIDYGGTPVFMENLRFNHNEISYFIEGSCEAERKTSTREAFKIFEEEMKIISFKEKLTLDSDIIVGCSDDFVKLGKNLFRAGEGGPSKIINTSNFKVIEEGRIQLYEASECSRPVVEIHEIAHVFGFDHIKNPKSIMYNISKCDQEITPDMVEIVNKLYSVEPLPDAIIKELSATKKKRYLDFNITILNEGLEDISNMSLTIISEGEKVEEFSLEEIKIGYGRTLRVTNIKLPSRNTNSVEFRVDYENKVRELSEENNKAEMKLAQ